AVMPLAGSHQSLPDIAASAHAHAEPIARALVHDAPLSPHKETTASLAHPIDVLERALGRAELGTAPGRLPLPPETAQHAALARATAHQGVLDRAAFAHRPQRLAGPELDRDGAAGHGPPEIPVEPANAQERLGHSAASGGATPRRLSQ